MKISLFHTPSPLQVCFFFFPFQVLNTITFLFKSQKTFFPLKRRGYHQYSTSSNILLHLTTYRHPFHVFQRKCLHFLMLKFTRYVLLTSCFLKAQKISIILALVFVTSAFPMVLLVLSFATPLRYLLFSERETFSERSSTFSS